MHWSAYVVAVGLIVFYFLGDGPDNSPKEPGCTSWIGTLSTPEEIYCSGWSDGRELSREEQLCITHGLYCKVVK